MSLSLIVMVALACAARADDLPKLEQRAFNAAVDAVAECVVQIRTAGGLDQVGGEVLAQGPTTGLILTADGFVVSSAFNFAQQPASVLVRLPDGKQRPAKIIGRDTNRMLVLLKVDVDKPLPVPAAAEIDDVKVGQWAVAVGRTFAAERVNVSVGVVSAKNRMHGRAVQTDANASAANYGGPLVDLAGRVIGVLVPMAPQAAGDADANELAGAEFYDSGIALAVPLEHILGVLDRWTVEHDLERGLLGVGMAEGSPHSTPCEITAVWPRSPAAKAGWNPGDVIVKVDGAAVASQTQLRFHIAPRYAGDAFKVTIRRGKGDDSKDDDAKEIETEITLAAKLEPYRHAFLGILPSRDSADATSSAEAENSDPTEDDDADSEPTTSLGVAIRAVWPGSPAAKAGLEPGDRITELGDAAISDVDAALTELAGHNPGDELKIVARRTGESLELTATLAELPTDVLAESELGGDDDRDESNDADAAPPELKTLKMADLPQAAKYYEPSGDGQPRGVLVWLAGGDEKTNKAIAEAWRPICDRDRLVLVLPAPADAKGWSSDDMEFLARLITTAITRLSADPRRIVIGGEGKGGQLAYAVGFKARRWVRGIAVVDSPLPRTLELPQNAPGSRLAVVSVETQNAPLGLLIRQDLKKIAEAGFPATQVERRTASTSTGQLDAVTRATLARWIDGLDRF